MDSCKYRTCALLQLKERNAKEHGFKEMIQYCNRLLESLDYMQKGNILRKIQATKLEQENLSLPSSNTHPMPDDHNLMTCYNLQKSLAESHKKMSDYAQQVIDLKNVLDEKNKLIATQQSELDRVQSSFNSYQNLCKNNCKQLAEMKSTLQDKIDECDVLNITYSSVENKKNDLEIENKKLKLQLAMLSLQKSSKVVNDKNITESAVQKGEMSVKKEASLKAQCSTVLDTMVGDSIIPDKVKHKFRAHDSEVNAVLWLPVQTQLITAGADRKVKLWEPGGSGVELKRSVRACNSSVMSVDVDFEGNLILCASCDFASRVWTVCDFTVRHTLTGHSGKVMSAKFMHEVNKIVTCSSDQTLKLWDLRRRVCAQTYRATSHASDVISRGSHSIVSGHADKKIRFWDSRTNNEVAQISASDGITSLDLANDFLLLACQRDSKLKLVDIRTHKEINAMCDKGFEVGCDWTRAKFSPDGQLCSCGSQNGSVFIWNVSSGLKVKELIAHNSNVISCHWSACGTNLATCESNGICVIWSNK